MGGKRSKKKKTKTKAQKAATARHAKFKQTRVQTFGGKRNSFSKKEESRIKKAGYSVKGYSSAAPNKASGYSGTTGVSVGSKIKNPNPKPKTSGIGPVKSGDQYAKSLSTATNQPTKKTTPKLVAEAPKKVNPFNLPGLIKEGDAAREGVRPEVKNPGFLDKILNRNSETQRMINELSAAPGGDKVAAADSSMSGLGIKTSPSYFRIKSPESFGAPSQADVDAAAGITAGGLNIGGGGFTPSNPSGGTTSRAVRDMTSEQLADRYEASLNPDSFKGLSDGETRGVGPVASGRAYAAGLNVDNKNVENIGRSILNKIPGVNIRRLTDKEIADNRVSAQKKLAYRKEMAQFRGARGGGARLPVAPLTPEEILSPEQTAVAPTVPDYQQAQTGVDPNRLMQIQQDAYLQAFNPSYNPMFRFFNRRGGARRGAFRRAFRRN